MAFNGTHLMPYANNITITTRLSFCDNTTWNLNQTLSDLRNLYENSRWNFTGNIFGNISIVNFNCTNRADSDFFEQIISFTQAISIRIQILFVSIYFDYLNANKFQFDGLTLDQDLAIRFSSITVNNSETTDACSSATIAQDPLCLSDSVCNPLSNPWNFTCSQLLVTTITPLVNSTSQWPGVVVSTGLNSWQIGLISGLSFAFVLFLLVISMFFYHRYRHSKQISISRVNFYDDVGFQQKSAMPQGQAFQCVATITQPKVRSHTTTSWIQDGIAPNSARNGETLVNLKPAGPSNQVSFVDHAKVHDPALPLNIPEEFNTSVNVSTSPPNRIRPPFLSPPVSRTPSNQLQLLINELQENHLNESDLSLYDENLTDEDAWMSILDVVNTELAILNGQDQIKTLI